MLAARIRDTPLDRLLAARNAERSARVGAQAREALSALRRLGVAGEIVGSLGRGEMGPNSDVDFLILDKGGLSGGQIFGVVSEHLKDAAFDLVYADQLAAASVALMRTDGEPKQRPES